MSFEGNLPAPDPECQHLSRLPHPWLEFFERGTASPHRVLRVGRPFACGLKGISRMSSVLNWSARLTQPSMTVSQAAKKRNSDAVVRPTAQRRPASRYDTLAQLLATDIQTGKYRVGETLPSESELQVRYGVSRHTVRQALRDLKINGLVTSHPGIGTVVKSADRQSRVVHSASTVEGYLNFSKETRIELLASSEVIANDELAALLMCPSGQAWHMIETLRHAGPNSGVLGHVTAYVRPEFAGVAKFVEKENRPLFGLLELHYGAQTAEIRQQVDSVPLGARLMRTLDSKSTHGLKIVRWYFDDRDRLLEVSIGVYPADRFSLQGVVRIQGIADVPL